MNGNLSPTLSIIIPAYEEKATFSQLLQNVLRASLPGIEKEIIVVESNSRDGTRALVQEAEARGQIKALYEPQPQGKGHAVRTGLAAATGEWILIQDADLEYNVADYPRLLAPIQRGETSFMLGSRHLGRQDWRYRRSGVGHWLGPVLDSGVWLFTQFFNGLYGVSLTDPCTMYKVFRRDCLQGIVLESNGFELDIELVAKLIRKGFHPQEIPVSYQARNFREGKKIRLWRDGYRVFLAIIRFRFSAL